MTKAITYILGTDHRMQGGQLDDEQITLTLIEEFKNELQRIVQKYHVEVIFEEWSSDASTVQGVQHTILQEIFPTGRLKPIQIDLDEEARSLLGCRGECINVSRHLRKFIGKEISNVRICETDPTSGQVSSCDCTTLADEIRERVWVTRIRAKGIWPALFVCGSFHVENTRDLLNRFGVPSEILHEDFGNLELV